MMTNDGHFQPVTEEVAQQIEALVAACGPERVAPNVVRYRDSVHPGTLIAIAASVRLLGGTESGAGMFRFPHRCRDGHAEIGHADSEHEQCPLCRLLGGTRDGVVADAVADAALVRAIDGHLQQMAPHQKDRQSATLLRAALERLRAPTHPAAADAGGAGLIAGERRRQVEVEGWTPAHDDEHANGELLLAANCYVQFAYDVEDGHALPDVPNGWPWDASWWKPSGDPARNLVKAGALIAAEIDRLLRAASGAARKVEG